MSAASAVTAGRRAAESLMLDTGRALRPTGGYEYVNGEEVQATEELFTSRCKAQTRTLVARESEVAGRTSTSIRTEIHLPADTDPLKVGDLWEFTAVSPISLAVVGQRVRVLGPVTGTLKTAARYEVEQVVT